MVTQRGTIGDQTGETIVDPCRRPVSDTIRKAARAADLISRDRLAWFSRASS
jgi:hypothetical protein